MIQKLVEKEKATGRYIIFLSPSLPLFFFFCAYLIFVACVGFWCVLLLDGCVYMPTFHSTS